MGNFILNRGLRVEMFLMMTLLLWRHLFTEHSLHVYYFPHQ